ncbi:hypothetical protein, partial [Photobacterium damselae]|uniref:hypothetical protein n=1 Tax=Photobacterium damselae TaxID=38293 RepID=UPI0014858672
LQPCLLKIYSNMVVLWGNYEGIPQCNISVELVQAKADGHGLRNHHYISNINSLSACQNAAEENNLTMQTILAYRSNGIDDIGKIEELGQFEYDSSQVFSYRDLVTAFDSMSVDELNQFNYISADFNDNSIHSSKSVLRQHSTNLDDRYIWLSRNVIRGTWSKQIQYKSGLYEFYCSQDGETWTPANKISDCDK